MQTHVNASDVAPVKITFSNERLGMSGFQRESLSFAFEKIARGETRRSRAMHNSLEPRRHGNFCRRGTARIRTKSTIREKLRVCPASETQVAGRRAVQQRQ